MVGGGRRGMGDRRGWEVRGGAVIGGGRRGVVLPVGGSP